MTKYIVLFALIGTVLCGLAASQAKAYSCNSFCYNVGGYRICNTNCN